LIPGRFAGNAAQVDRVTRRPALLPESFALAMWLMNTPWFSTTAFQFALIV